VGLGKAARLAKEALDRGNDEKMAAMRNRLQQGILAQVEEAGVNGGGAARVPNTTNIHFDHIDGEAMVIALDLKGMAVSTGAACSSGAIEPSHVLVAMGLRTDQARASIRFSLGKQTVAEDIDVAVALVPEVVARLRELSPMYRRPALSS
jgi:cysteine desulfurase